MWLIHNRRTEFIFIIARMLAYCDNTRQLLQYTCLLESSMANGTVNNAKNQFLTLEFTTAHYAYVYLVWFLYSCTVPLTTSLRV